MHKPVRISIKELISLGLFEAQWSVSDGLLQTIGLSLFEASQMPLFFVEIAELL